MYTDDEKVLAEKRLEKKLFQRRMPPEGRSYLRDPEWDVQIIERDGTFRSKSDIVQRIYMKRGNCHPNACRALNKYETCHIETGYAFSDNEGWLSHSWLVNKEGKIIETTATFEEYYGYTLSSDDVKKFSRRTLVAAKINAAWGDTLYGGPGELVPRLIREFYECGDSPTIEDVSKELAGLIGCSKKTAKEFLSILIEDNSIIAHEGLLEIPGEKPKWGKREEYVDHYNEEDS